MYKPVRFYFVLTFIAAAMFAFVSCTKEGPQGPPGKDGEDGIDGQDGTATCTECHDNSQVQFAKQIQWSASVHATGGNFERNDAECAACHTSQGFLQRMANGTHEADGKVVNPNPPNCYTCHNIHTTYTAEDYKFTYADPFNLWINGQPVDFGNGNLCANCHQPRIPDPLPVVGGEDVNITSPYWGAHYGTQAAILGGSGGYEVGGGYSNSLHTSAVTNACVTCHMADPYGVESGGHTMKMHYSYHGQERLNVAGCVSCHSDTDALTDLVETTQSEIGNLLGTLGTILLQQGLIDSTGRAVPGTMTADQAGAVMNYNMVRKDGSFGVHNFKYSKALIENSTSSLQK